MADIARIAFGPNLAPVRNGEPLSEGMPIMATSVLAASARCGKRMKEGTPTNLGTSRESMGDVIAGSFICLEFRFTLFRKVADATSDLAPNAMHLRLGCRLVPVWWKLRRPSQR